MSSIAMEKALTPGLQPRQPKGQGRRPNRNHDDQDHQERGDGPSRSKIKKDKIVKNATKGKDAEIAELKRQLKKGKGNGKAGGKGDKGKGKSTPLPNELREGGKHQGVSGDGRRICYAYNMAKGCTDCQPGKNCSKGYHICSRKGCKGTHSAKDCTLS